MNVVVDGYVTWDLVLIDDDVDGYVAWDVALINDDVDGYAVSNVIFVTVDVTDISLDTFLVDNVILDTISDEVSIDDCVMREINPFDDSPLEMMLEVGSKVDCIIEVCTWDGDILLKVVCWTVAADALKGNCVGGFEGRVCTFVVDTFSDVVINFPVVKSLEGTCDVWFKVCVRIFVVSPNDVEALENSFEDGLVIEICDWIVVTFPEIGNCKVVNPLDGDCDNGFNVEIRGCMEVIFPRKVVDWNAVVALKGVCVTLLDADVCVWSVVIFPE